MKYLSIVLRALLTIAFVGAGSAKLAGVEMMVHTFEQVGFGQWFRYVTGIIEVGCGILLWIPGRQALAALLLGATMVGAVIAHLTVLNAAEGVPAIVLGLICALLVFIHRDQLGGKTA